MQFHASPNDRLARRSLDDLLEATGQNTKSKAIDQAAAYYVKMTGRTTAVREVAKGSPHLADVRGKELFIGAEFVDANGDPRKDAVLGIQTQCYENGVLVWTAGRYDNVLRIIPPLVLTREQEETGIDIVEDAVAGVTGS